MASMYERGKARKPRSEGFRKLELGYYIIVTDAEKTEKNYFEGLRESFPSDKRDQIRIEVVQVGTRYLVDKAVELRDRSTQNSEVWIVFDRDQVREFDGIVEQAERAGIRVGWSNPCFEVWLLALLGKIGGTYHTSGSCVERFKRAFEQKSGQLDCGGYKSWKDIYPRVHEHGDVGKAIDRSRARHNSMCSGCGKPSLMDATTAVYLLVEVIEAAKETD